LCDDEVAAAQTMTELRAIEKKFADIAKAAGDTNSTEENTTEDTLRGIEVTHLYTRAMPEGATSTPTYMTIRNTGTHFDRLVGISTPLAEHIVLQRPVWSGLKMRMETVREIDLPPGATVILRAGNYQGTLVNVGHRLRPNVTVPIELHFERAGTIDVVSKVENRLLVN
jgi:copper(I)-binding protein